MKKFKILIDILLFIVTVLLFDIELIGNLNHEILGITIGVLIIIHLGLHLDRIFVKIKNKKIKIVIYVVYVIITILVAIYFTYTLTHSFQWLYSFKKNNW